MKFLLNMNVSRAVGDELTRLGQEWDHARNLGLATADDRQIVALAQRESRVIVTHDLDYGDLLMLSGVQGERRCSAIIFRLRRSKPPIMCHRLQQAWGQIQTALATGAIVVIEDAAVRIRSLPGDIP